MTPEQRQEEISKAYVHAVAAACGFAVGIWSQDHGCLDVTLSGGRGKPKLDLQLKATTQARNEREGDVWWQVSQEHYDVMRAAEVANPHFFVLLILPEDPDLSVEHTVQHLLIRKCAYWKLMTGAPPKAAKSPTITIPKTQAFSPSQARQLMEDARALKHLQPLRRTSG